MSRDDYRAQRRQGTARATLAMLRHDAYLLAFNTARCVLTGLGYGIGIWLAMLLMGILKTKS